VTSPFKIVVVGVACVITFDVVAAYASMSIGFPYPYAVVGSWVIYATVGFLVGRVSSVPHAVAGVANVALAEGTIGWWLSSLIGPGRPQAGISPNQLVATVVTLVVTGGIIGAAAGSVGRSGTN
jgi:hypothetical protein